MSFATIEITLKSDANILDTIRLLRCLKERTDVIEDIDFEVD